MLMLILFYFLRKIYLKHACYVFYLSICVVNIYDLDYNIWFVCNFLYRSCYQHYYC